MSLIKWIFTINPFMLLKFNLILLKYMGKKYLHCILKTKIYYTIKYYTEHNSTTLAGTDMKYG